MKHTFLALAFAVATTFTACQTTQKSCPAPQDGKSCHAPVKCPANKKCPMKKGA